METLSAGAIINNFRILSAVSQSSSEIVYNAYDVLSSRYVTVKEFCPQKLNIRRVDTEIIVDAVDRAKYDEMSVMFQSNAKLSDDNTLLSLNNTFYIISPQIIDTNKRDEIFSNLKRIDNRYEIADLKGKSKDRISALSEYEKVLMSNPDFFYMHLKSVNNLADCYYYNYHDDALTANAINECVKFYSKKELKEKAFNLYVQSAYRGSAYAQSQIGHFYDNGYGCLCNYKLAAYWYSEAYNNGYKDSGKRLGDFYFYGQGVNQCYEEAVKVYENAAEVNSDACLMLVKCYTEGLGVNIDSKKVYYYLNKAYELGNTDPNTYIKLARCLITADGVEENLEEANKLIRKAALLRNANEVSNFINNIYSKKKMGFKNKVKCMFYKALSRWDYILTGTTLVGIICGLIYLGFIFG